VYDHTAGWLAEFPEAGLDSSCAGELELIHQLILLDMGELYKKALISEVKKIHGGMLEKVVARAEFRFLPLMSGCCDGQIGAVNAESIAERIIFCANLAVADYNNLLSDKALEVLVIWSLCGRITFLKSKSSLV
jgi:hypothetical protein